MGVALRHLVQRALAWSTRGPSTPPSTTCAPAAWSTTPTAPTWFRSHRVRRRQGPGAGQERRRAHLPAARHRLPPRQVRPGLRAARSTCGAPITTATSPGCMAAMQALGHDPDELEVVDHARWSRLLRGGERGQALQAHRRHHRARATCSTRSVPTPPASPTSSSRSTRRRRSTSTSSRRSPWTTRSSTCRWPTPASARIARVAAERGVERRELGRRSTCPLLVHDRELEVLRALCEPARGGRAGRAATGRRTASPPGCASWPARSTASTTTAT